MAGRLTGQPTIRRTLGVVKVAVNVTFFAYKSGFSPLQLYERRLDQSRDRERTN